MREKHLTTQLPVRISPMTLTFLGQKYEATMTAETASVEAELSGKYRGNAVTFSSPRSTAPANVALTYRGIRYSR